jgi:hypothetical protein
MSAVSFIALLPFALTGFSFAAKNFLEGLPKKLEQFFRGPELQPLAGIHFFHRPFELASCGVRLASESYYKSSSHDG